MEDEDKVACRTPAEGRDGVTRIPAWKYAAVRRAILNLVRNAIQASPAGSEVRVSLNVPLLTLSPSTW